MSSGELVLTGLYARVGWAGSPHRSDAQHGQLLRGREREQCLVLRAAILSARGQEVRG